jgi:hypothetical protein
MMILPAVSGFSATVPAPAAPIFDCAQPHATAPSKKDLQLSIDEIWANILEGDEKANGMLQREVRPIVR